VNIIYLTTSLQEDDFLVLNKFQGQKANPSNQNFHRRMIDCLKINNHVHVICYRPITKYFNPLKLSYEYKSISGLSYYYPPIINVPIIKQWRFKNFTKRLVKKLIKKKKEKSLIIVDSLNATLSKIASLLSETYGYKIVGIVTDHPKNITGMKSFVKRRITDSLSYYDGYICLTPHLNTIANPYRKPHLIIPGIVESRTVYPIARKPYFFWCGSTYEKYGIINLIEAFKKVDKDVDLVMAGHGLSDQIKKVIDQDSRCHFLGALSQSEIYQYQTGALANINPRPTNKIIDDFSVPSKMFEYLSSGSPTISTEHPLLYDIFKTCAFWAGNGRIDELKSAIENFLLLSEARHEKMGSWAKTYIFTKYGTDVVAEQIQELLTSIK
jgi:glycosyltransferase involved in cell wall biosynthesis